MDQVASLRSLTTGGADDPFLPHLLEAIFHADEIELAVAFIKITGLRLIFDALAEALERGKSLKILTTDYLNVTDPEALRQLMLLSERGADVRIFESAGESFHLKAYIFIRSASNNWARVDASHDQVAPYLPALRGDGPADDGSPTDNGSPASGIIGEFFIGSSNISWTALNTGLEWNYRVLIDENSDPLQIASFVTIRERFAQLFAHPKSLILTDEWIESYIPRFQKAAPAQIPGAAEKQGPATPTPIQIEALAALTATRAEGYRRGLVVMATGLGKTWLAAFDAAQMNATRILFVAHREEILMQAENTMLRIRPEARVGRYNSTDKDRDVDILCASIQTIGRANHLATFPADHFDYIVVDEFHHAAANTYRRLLGHFKPGFLLGLTATPDRTDQSDILGFCDDNLVYTYNLFQGVTSENLVPFHYNGIFDETVDYQAIPWRNSKFDPTLLSNTLATLNRANHVQKKWTELAGERTLAFCISIKHADYMAEEFNRRGIPSASVHGKSKITRKDGLDRLESGNLKVVFSVDLFNEGVDLPSIDTVMMLRPTESKILFLQQLGRGLRLCEGKTHLVVMDFLGNHHGFFNKPQALFGIGPTNKALSDFARKVEDRKLELPDGCFVNYDLEIINFLKNLADGGLQSQYEVLKDSLGRRPTLTEMYHSGVIIRNLRANHGDWWSFVDDMGDLLRPEQKCLTSHKDFFRELETTKMTKSFKMVLLESLMENDGFRNPPTVAELSRQAFDVFRRRRKLLSDLPAALRNIDQVDEAAWRKYWEKNPINAWIGGNVSNGQKTWFAVQDDRFVPTFDLAKTEDEAFDEMLMELVNYRILRYEAQLNQVDDVGKPQPDESGVTNRTMSLPFFPNIQIACGHFKTGQADAPEYKEVPVKQQGIDPNRHFLARASGHSMNGGERPVRDGDYLVMESITSPNAATLVGQTIGLERINEKGEAEYLLRMIRESSDGKMQLHATNPEFEDIDISEDINAFTRLVEVIDPLRMRIGESFMRADIPELFGAEFNGSVWNTGHVGLKNQKAHILLVTLNKQSAKKDQKYLDYFIDENTFHWQSQNNTAPGGKRGREIINHKEMGIGVHLFVRENKLNPNGKAASFVYYGEVDYQSHEGSNPMSVVWKL